MAELPNFSWARSSPLAGSWSWLVSGARNFFGFTADCLMKLVERTGPAGVVGSRSRVSTVVDGVDGQRKRLHEQRPFLLLLRLLLFLLLLLLLLLLCAHRLRHFSLENACKSLPLLCTYAMIIAEIRPTGDPMLPERAS